MKSCIRKTGFISAVLAICLVSIAQADELKQRQQAAAQVTSQLLRQLGGALKKEMGSQGPSAAIDVCRDKAPQIAGDLSRRNGWRVTRVSQKPRNPMLGTPDAWEMSVLQEFEARAAKGEPYADMTFSEVVTEGGERFFRYMKPIATKPLCLSCHGSRDQIPQAVQARLETDYPFDKATGYRPGELRGAVSIKQPMDIALPKMGTH